MQINSDKDADREKTESQECTTRDTEKKMQRDTRKEIYRDKERHRERLRCTGRNVAEREKRNEDCIEYLDVVTSEVNLTPGLHAT